MEIKDINYYDVLKAPLPFIGFVTSINNEKDVVTLNDGQREMNFMPRCLKTATPSEAAPFALTMEAHKQKVGVAVSPGETGKTPEEIRAGLKRFEDELSETSPEALANFKKLWREMMSLAGDFPGKTWDMRWQSKKHFCPVLKANRKGTNEWVRCLYLLVGNNLRLEIVKEFLPEECDYMFPKRNRMVGTTHAVKMDYASFKGEKKASYIALLKAVYACR